MIDHNDSAFARVSLEHWRTLAAVVDEGGYARAAEALCKSQSTVSHGVQRLEELLETRVLKIDGRRAVLTDVGRVALRRAKFLLNEAAGIERVAHALAVGIEPEITIAVDPVLPNQVLLPALGGFTKQHPDTRIEVIETDTSGITETLVKGHAQLAVTPVVPEGWLGSRLIELETVCVAHPGHPLHALDGALTERDLRQYRQLVVRGSGSHPADRTEWLSSEQRLTVSTRGTLIQALCHGLGFAWCPIIKIKRELDEGLLKPVPLSRGGSRFVSLYLVFADEEGAGPATHALAKYIEVEALAASEESSSTTVW